MRRRQHPEEFRLALAIALSFATCGCPEEKSPAQASNAVPALKETPEKSAESASSAQSPQTSNSNTKTNAVSAAKAPLPPLAQAHELEFDVRNGSLWVHGPGLSTSLSTRARSVTQTSHRGSTITLKYRDEYSCKGDEVLKQELSFFLARLENTRAFRLYQNEKFTEAAQGFRRAMTLDPGYPKPRTNHIAALCRAGDAQGAEQAFIEAMKEDPVTVYEKLLSDSDFAPLRKRFRSKPPFRSFLELKDGRLPPLGAFSAARDLLAVVRVEESWGAENWVAELFVFRASTRQLLSKHSLVTWQDVQEDGTLSPARLNEIRARLKRFNETLTALQFVTSPDDMRSEFEPPDPEKPRLEAPFPSLGLRISGENDSLEILRHENVLETLELQLKGARPHSVYVFPEMAALVYLGLYEVAEGCDSGPETRLELLSTPHFAKPAK